MKTTLLFIAFSFFCGAVVAQVQKDENGFEYFEIKERDSVTIMKKYFVVFLIEGPNRSQLAEEAQQIQAGHMAHMQQMADNNQLHIAGPFADKSKYKGIFILNVPTMEAAEALVAADPAVKSGRLIGEIHPWWSAKGASLK